jgi:hypothetical protein
MRHGMAEQLNPIATPHLPAFITSPGQTDVLMIVLAVFLGLCIFAFGVFYWRLPSYSTRHRKAKESKDLMGIFGDRSWARKAII